MPILKDTTLGSTTTQKAETTKLSFDSEKDKRIWISGILQAVISSPSIFPFIQREADFAPKVEEITTKMLELHTKLTKTV